MKGCKFLLILGLLSLSGASMAQIYISDIRHIEISCNGDSIAEELGQLSVAGGGCPIGYNLSYVWTFPDGTTTEIEDTISDLSQTGTYEVQKKCTKIGETPLYGTPIDVNMGYQVDWSVFHQGAYEEITDEYINLKNDLSNSWCREATSGNVLNGDTDGWLEIKVDATTHHKYFGFRLDPPVKHCGVNDPQDGYGLYLKSGASLVKVEKGSQTSLTSYAVDDLIRIEYNDSDGKVYYYKNGTQIGSSDPNTTWESANKLVEGKIYTNQAELKNIGSSFKPPFPVNVDVTDILCSDSTNGFIELDPCLNGSFTYTWDHTATDTSFLDSLDVGGYSVEIVDTSGWTVLLDIHVGYDANWSSPEKTIIISEDTLKKNTGGSIAFNAGAKSRHILEATNDGWLEFQISEGTKLRAVGFSNNPGTSFSKSDMDYGIYLLSDTTWKRIENGSENGPARSFNENDIIRIEKSGSNYSIRVNDFKCFNRSITDQDYNLLAIFKDLNGTVTKARTSWECDTLAQSFAKLKKELDGGHIYSFDQMLRVKYSEDYMVGTGNILEYRIYDESRNLVGGVDENGTPLVTGSPELESSYGDNNLTFNLRSLSLNSGYYFLEVTSSKDQTLFLKFKLL